MSRPRKKTPAKKTRVVKPPKSKVTRATPKRVRVVKPKLTVTKGALREADVSAAVVSVSLKGAFRFTMRNLFYEMVRRGSVAAPEGDPSRALRTFREALNRFEARRGKLPGLIRIGRVRARISTQVAEPDVFDYSVRRFLVFDRLETLLLFARNGFHRRIEMGLLTVDRFPRHVFDALKKQFAARMQTTFFVVHDANRMGYLARRRFRALLGDDAPARVVDVGMTYGQAFQLGLPVRTGPRTRRDLSREGIGPKARVMLERGNYVHVEELTPLRALRWVYRHVAKGAQDSGFG